MVAQLADQRCGVRRDVRSLSVAPEHLNTNLTEAELLEIVAFNEFFVRKPRISREVLTSVFGRR